MRLTLLKIDVEPQNFEQTKAERAARAVFEAPGFAKGRSPLPVFAYFSPVKSMPAEQTELIVSTCVEFDAVANRQILSEGAIFSVERK